MALVPQNADGDAAGANCYHTLAEFKAYHDARGNDYTAFTDPQINAAIIRGTDYLETRFNFRGIRLTSTQTTEWPRKAGSALTQPWYDVNFLVPQFDSDFSTFVALVDSAGNDILGIPEAIKRASYEYSFRALAAALYQDAPAPDGGREILESTVKVDVIEQSLKFQAPQAGGFVIPAYPQADLWLSRAGLIESGRSLFR